MSMASYSPLPYPPVCAAGKNPAYARAILSNVGGSNSEMSAVSLYFYNNLVACAHEEIAKTFHDVSVVEMHHLEIFGRLAFQLGADPRLWNQKGSHMMYWTPAYNRYPLPIKALLQNALEGEEAAIAKYECQASWICDQNVVENIQRILVDERIHVEIFKSLLETLC